ncbi:TonB-dependent receptor domain-containing protein [Bacteroidota bacterium]
MSGIYKIMVLSLLVFVGISFAQRGKNIPMSSITGKIVDADDNLPLEYANVLVYDSLTSVMVTGSATDSEGVFTVSKLRPGRYYVEVKYIGYDDDLIESVQIRSRNMKVDLGTIKLNRAAYQIDGVQVIGDQISMEYKIDKKVINVAQQSTSLSGTAIDVLENAPSITVDIEGNVSLRGSTDFLVLIDNKPTVFDPSDALEQIPASAIDKIEIITNPSAKYDPEGTSGIINLITKKNSLDGFNGQINLNGGMYGRYGGDILINYRAGDFNIFLGGNYNKRSYPGERYSLTETIVSDTSNFLESNGDHERKRDSYSVKGGFSLNITDSDIITLQGRYGHRDFGGLSTLYYKEWTQPIGIENLYTSKIDHTRGGEYYTFNFDYTHKFNPDGHQLVLQAYYSDRESNDLDINKLFDESNNITSAQKYIEGGPETRLRFNLDYKLPFNEKNYIEAGYQADLNTEEGFNDAYELDLLLSDYVFIPEFSNSTKYTKEIQSMYSTYTSENGNFGYQLGLRGEYTYRTMELFETAQTFTIDRFDFFPTLHLSYNLGENSQVMASYSRRIHRPRDHALEPFLTWMDAYNVRQGNPNLEPEYINSFEAGYQKHFEWGSVSMEGYYRIRKNKFERVRSVYDTNIMLNTYENVGSSYSLGTELMFSTSFYNWWSMNLTGNLYDYKQDGELYGRSYNNQSFNWSLRLNNQMIIIPTTKLQIMMMFNSPTVTSQGRREGMYMLNAALRHEFIPKTLTATLQVRDILGSAKHEFTTEGPSFYSTMEMTRRSPRVTLTLSYNINNYKKDMERDEENGEDMQMDEEF